MKVADFPTFAARAERLVQASPLATRCVIKYDHTKGSLTVRVTDDATVLQFATDQLADVKRVERLAARCMEAAATGALPAEGDTLMADAAKPAAVAGGGRGGGRAGSAASGGGGRPRRGGG